MSTMRKLVFGCLPALLFACAIDEDEGDPASVPKLHERLQDGARVYVSSGGYTVIGSVAGARGVQENAAVSDGSIQLLISRDQVLLNEWKLALGDIRIPMPEGRIYLEDVSVRFAEPVVLDAWWNTNLDEVVASGTIDLIFEWRFVAKNGRRVGMPEETVEGVRFEAKVTSDYGDLSATFGFHRDGPFWIRHGVLALSDLHGWFMGTDVKLSVEP